MTSIIVPALTMDLWKISMPAWQNTKNMMAQIVLRQSALGNDIKFIEAMRKLGYRDEILVFVNCKETDIITSSLKMN